jgi:chaperone required for assembly of F1-ATPase
MVEEWNAQAEHIIPTRMPLTQLAFAAIDATATKRDEVADYITKFGETDLCCHRAASPVDLVAHQDAHWSSLRDWLHAHVGADLPVVTGVLPADVPQGELAKLRAAALALDDFRLTALAQAAGLAGSAIIGFAILHEKVTPTAAFQAAALDELWSQEKWGADAQAQARLTRQKAEFEALARFVAALA